MQNVIQAKTAQPDTEAHMAKARQMVRELGSYDAKFFRLAMVQVQCMEAIVSALHEVRDAVRGDDR